MRQRTEKPDPSTIPTGFAYFPSYSDIHRYMRGECAYFALALHSLLGFELITVGAEHFAVRDPQGYCWDVRGRQSPEQFVKDIRGSRIIEPTTVEEIKDLLSTGLYSDGPYLPSRLRKAKKLARYLLGMTD